MIRELIDTDLEAVAGGLNGNQNTVTFGNITLNPTINANGGNANGQRRQQQRPRWRRRGCFQRLRLQLQLLSRETPASPRAALPGGVPVFWPAHRSVLRKGSKS